MTSSVKQQLLEVQRQLFLYHMALENRQDGYIAASKLVANLEDLFGKQYQPGCAQQNLNELMDPAHPLMQPDEEVFNPATSKCDTGIYKDGNVVCWMAGANARTIEAFVQKVAQDTGEPVDWHYVGGRAVIKTLGCVEVVREAVRTNMFQVDLDLNVAKES